MFVAIFIIYVGLFFPQFSFAQGMMNGNDTTISAQDGHTAREEATGKEVWENLQAKELECKDLGDDDFGALGEYFMGQMMADSHEAMNDRLIQMWGEEGEERMHIAMGKRMSGCEPNAAIPNGGMMGMMVNGNVWEGGENDMMGNFIGNPMGGFGFGWIFMIVFWILILIGIVYFIKLIVSQGKDGTLEKSPLDILKERYAKGEIGKKEFEEKKNDLK